MSEDRIERITAAEFRSWSELAGNPSIDHTSPHVGTMRTALGRACSELVRLRAEVIVLTKTSAEIEDIRIDLAQRLGLTIEDFTEKPRRRGANSKAIKLAIAAEILRRRFVQREAIGVVLGYSKPGIDNLLQIVSTRMRAAPAFAAYVESVCK